MNLALKIKASDLAKGFEGLLPHDFALKNAGRFEPELLNKIAGQLDFNQTIQSKIPEWFQNKQLLPAAGINLQQSSSQATAQYKSHLLQGKNGLDLSGGLGVDTYFFAKNFERFTHNEPNSELSETVQYNFGQLGVENVKFTQEKAENFQFTEKYDWVYLDPSRRDSNNRKLFKISDCQPDICAMKEKIFAFTDQIMIKYSPMLDVKLAISQLGDVNRVIILAEKNEVKELVFILKKGIEKEPVIECVNLGSDQPGFVFKYSKEEAISPVYGLEEGYLFEPNSAIYKAGAFKLMADKFGIKKLSANSHLYTAKEIQTNFPGKTFKIIAVTKFDNKSLNRVIKEKKANIIARNFPLKPVEIKKKLGWGDGGDFFSFFTRNQNNRNIVIITTKL